MENLQSKYISLVSLIFFSKLFLSWLLNLKEKKERS